MTRRVLCDKVELLMSRTPEKRKPQIGESEAFKNQLGAGSAKRIQQEEPIRVFLS